MRLIIVASLVFSMYLAFSGAVAEEMQISSQGSGAYTFCDHYSSSNLEDQNVRTTDWPIFGEVTLEDRSLAISEEGSRTGFSWCCCMGCCGYSMNCRAIPGCPRC